MITEVPGYAQMPSKPGERCPVSGLKRGTFLKYFERWKNHPEHPVRCLHLKERTDAKRGVTLYHKGDLQQLLDYEAACQSKERRAS